MFTTALLLIISAPDNSCDKLLYHGLYDVIDRRSSARFEKRNADRMCEVAQEYKDKRIDGSVDIDIIGIGGGDAQVSIRELKRFYKKNCSESSGFTGRSSALADFTRTINADAADAWRQCVDGLKHGLNWDFAGRELRTVSLEYKATGVPEGTTIKLNSIAVVPGSLKAQCTFDKVVGGLKVNTRYNFSCPPPKKTRNTCQPSERYIVKREAFAMHISTSAGAVRYEAREEIEPCGPPPKAPILCKQLLARDPSKKKEVTCSPNDEPGYGWILTGVLLQRWGQGTGNGNNGVWTRGPGGPPKCGSGSQGALAQAAAYGTGGLYAPELEGFTDEGSRGHPATSSTEYWRLGV